MASLPTNIKTQHAPNNAGNGVFTTLSIRAGDEIFRIDRPLVSVLDSPHVRDACSNCYVWVPENGVGQFGEEKGSQVKLRACVGCKIDRYCSKAGSVPDTEWQNFLKVQSHIDDFRSSDTKKPEGLTTWQTIELMSQAASTYSESREPLPLIQALTARVLINTLTLTTPTFDPLGLCVSPLSSLINHSCNPNAVVVYAGPTLALRSLAPIPADNEITISYIDTTNPTPSRQAELQNRYFFTCACPSCSAHSTNGLKDPVSDTAFEAISVRAIELQNQAAGKPPEEASQMLKMSLKLFTPYPPYRQPHPTILHTAFLNAVATQSWPTALSYALRAYFHIDPIRYPLSWHPVRVVRKWVLLRCVVHIAGLVGDKDANVVALERFRIDWQAVAIGLLREVEDGVQLSHGGDSPFTDEVKAFGEGLGIGAGEIVERRLLEEMWGRLKKVADADL